MSYGAASMSVAETVAGEGVFSASRTIVGAEGGRVRKNEQDALLGNSRKAVAVRAIKSPTS